MTMSDMKSHATAKTLVLSHGPAKKAVKVRRVRPNVAPIRCFKMFGWKIICW